MATVDSIILSTGYQYHFQFLGDDLRLYSTLSLYPADLYKGALWLKGGNNKLFYMGTQDQYYTFTMFDVQALWICKYVLF
jgi:trimethylamine monooxygenase